METLAISVLMALFTSVVAPIPWFYGLKYKYNPYPFYDYKMFLTPRRNQQPYGPQQQAIATTYLNCNRPAAISFCMDGQVSRTANEWSLMTDLVSSLVDRLSLSQRGLLVSAFSYGYTITHQIKPTSQLVLFKLLVSGIPRSSYGGNTALCLKTSRYYISKITPSVNKIIVVLTGPSTLNMLRDMTEGLYARQSGILVLGVGIGGISPSLPHVVTNQQYMYSVPTGLAGLRSPQLADDILHGLCGGIPLGQAARSTPVPAVGSTPVPVPATESTPVPVLPARSTSVSAPAAGSTPVYVPAGGSTPVYISAAGSTPVSEPAAGITSVSVPAAASTPLSVPPSESTPVPILATGNTPDSVPPVGSTPVPVSSTGSTSVPVLPTRSISVSAPVARSTPVPVPSTGSTPVPASGSTLAVGSTPVPVPATGSTPVSVYAAASTPIPLPAAGSTLHSVPAALSTPPSVPATGSTPFSIPATGSSTGPISRHTSVTATGNTLLHISLTGNTHVSVTSSRNTAVPETLSTAFPVAKTGRTTDHALTSQQTSVPSTGSTQVPVTADVTSRNITVPETASTLLSVIKSTHSTVYVPTSQRTSVPSKTSRLTYTSGPQSLIGVTHSSASSTVPAATLKTSLAHWTDDGSTKFTSSDLTNIVDSSRPVSSSPAIPSELCLGCIVIAGFGFNPYPGDCSKYVQCAPKASGWTVFLRECALGQFWSQDALTCAPAETVTCSSDPCIATGRNARVSVGGNCRTYYECVNGRVKSTSCCQESQILVNGGCVASSSSQCKDVCLFNRTQSISAVFPNTKSK